MEITVIFMNNMKVKKVILSAMLLFKIDYLAIFNIKNFVLRRRS